MSRKSTNAYESVFQYIKKNIFDMDGYSFMTDYETSMRNALKNTFPLCKFYACWFHFCQAIKRRCEQDNTLRLLIKTDQHINKIYHKFLCLPLLPAADIPQGFEIIKIELNCLPGKKAFQDFLKYFRNQWLKRVSIPIKYIKLKINLIFKFFYRKLQRTYLSLIA